MSSFQFPANPSDGDIVVRGDLQAFYNAATNTWRVSQLPDAPGIPGPPGPPGPEGPPGQGVSISGSVATYADLPAPNTAQFNFWITDDTNTLWYSDGIQWIDFGSPIQGPQGNPGEPGTNGTNGQNGRGWYDTQITDDADGYRIQFLSNDGLGFFTDDLRGPAGALEVASETNLGGIKIGKGLEIEPDGTANAAQAYVNIDGIELEGDGGSFFTLNYSPQFYTFNDPKVDFRTGGGYSNSSWATDSVTMTMPSNCSSAIVYFFASTTMQAADDFPGVENATYAFRAYMGTQIALTDATFDAGNSSIMAFASTHNLTIGWSAASAANRKSTLPVTKINKISFNPGATVKFDFTQVIEKAGYSDLTGGLGRLIVVPYKDESSTANVPFVTVAPGVYTDGADTYFADSYATISNYWNIGWTTEEANADYAQGIKLAIYQTISTINQELDYVSGTTAATLIDYRDQLRNLRSLPATGEEILEQATTIINAVEAIIGYSFIFE